MKVNSNEGFGGTIYFDEGFSKFSSKIFVVFVLLPAFFFSFIDRSENKLAGGFFDFFTKSDETQEPDIFPAFPHKVVFQGKGVDGYSDIYVMNCDGTNVKNLTNDTFDSPDFCLHPKKQEVIYSSNENGIYELFKIDLTSGQKSQFLKCSGANLRHPSICPENPNLVGITKAVEDNSNDGFSYEVFFYDLNAANEKSIMASLEFVSSTMWKGKKLCFSYELPCSSNPITGFFQMCDSSKAGIFSYDAENGKLEKVYACDICPGPLTNGTTPDWIVSNTPYSRASFRVFLKGQIIRNHDRLFENTSDGKMCVYEKPGLPAKIIVKKNLFEKDITPKDVLPIKSEQGGFGFFPKISPE